MQYKSLNGKAKEVNFEDAAIKGIAEDKGLYFPKNITPLPASFFENINEFSNNEIAFKLIKQFVGDSIPKDILKTIIEGTLSFDFPLVSIEPNIYALELYHGPTMAFKDVGARFMARCFSYFNKNNPNEVTVLVATSGDTGGAVANGFLGVKGVNVIILYPKGKVSDIQEKQLTTLGQNITAFEVNGTFDDCQAMVKEAFLDTDITSKKQLTSANSINIARWLPQMFYFVFAYKQLKDKEKPLVFAVPSGNFGNICAGMMAQKLGLPVKMFIAATNINAVVPNYLETGIYAPKPSTQTIANAMDVGDPSNFIRIQHLFDDDLERLKEMLYSESFTDDETRAALKLLKEKFDYLADPHGAIGYLGLKSYLKTDTNCQGVFLETAHPVKFLDVVEPVIKEKIEIPEQIKDVLTKEKCAKEISSYAELKAYLLQ
ncbi:MAG: threonine synthase [Flavobacteriales bacterium]|mgnify:CR=1 FL=1|jgi:threonine synthase|nr:threonine synthase [Flavobacteriales bacterium]